MNKNAKAFLEAATAKFGPAGLVTRDDIDQLILDNPGLRYPYWMVSKEMYRVKWGQYRLPLDGIPTPPVPVENPTSFATVEMLTAPSKHSLRTVPRAFPGYVPFGFFKKLRAIISSGQFFPVFITGVSGNGKTMMVEQVCSTLDRECIRVNISVETDQDDLLGGPTLQDGNIVNRDGPVLLAMRRGAVLLIDEVDRGSNKLMCLQGILEGKPYFNKKTGETIVPASGFTIIATANTKGQGSTEGKYLASILDDAFLERFTITVEQEFPGPAVEEKILKFILSKPEDKTFVEHLVQWAQVVRKTHEQGGIDEVISTRRLTHIAQTYNIFHEKLEAIRLCVSRFDMETKEAFIDLYTKIDETVVPETFKVDQASQPSTDTINAI